MHTTRPCPEGKFFHVQINASLQTIRTENNKANANEEIVLKRINSIFIHLAVALTQK